MEKRDLKREINPDANEACEECKGTGIVNYEYLGYSFNVELPCAECFPSKHEREVAEKLEEERFGRLCRAWGVNPDA